jgi:hypothetical protein
MAQDRVLHAQLHVDKCTAELFFNGIPLVRIDPTKRTAFESRPVEELVVPGTNRLELVVEPGSHPSVARTELRQMDTGDAWAEARLISFPDGVFVEPENGTVLAAVRFEKPLPNEATSRTMPTTLYAEAELGAANGRWAWQDAPVLEPGEALFAEARAVLEELATLYKKADTGAIWAYFEAQTKDMARAYPAFTEAMARNELEVMTAHHTKIADRVLPFRPEEHDFRLVAGGRLLETIDRDWKGSLRIKDPDDGTEMPVTHLLGRIDGRLRVVR